MMKERPTMASASPSARMLLAGMLLLSTGCSTIAHYADPYQWRKLNRGADYGRDSYNFSIPEPKLETPTVKPARNIALDLPNSRSLIPVSTMHD
jgi:hypothetical protein